MKKLLGMTALFAVAVFASGCDENQPQSTSGVKKATVKVQTDTEGLTTEQQNIRDRLLEDNKPGSIKHLYVISAYSGQIIIYSTVRGKVMSGGKRLTPASVGVTDGGGVSREGMGIRVVIGGQYRRTGEAFQDDGTYGKLMNYLYRWDTKGVYHQHYVSGGQIVHISSQPLAAKGIIINMPLSKEPESENDK